MKILKHLIFTVVAVAGLSLSASAQKSDQNRPPKNNPPVIDPGNKRPPRDNPPQPRGGDKPKKPGMAVLVAPGFPPTDELV